LAICDNPRQKKEILPAAGHRAVRSRPRFASGTLQQDAEEGAKFQAFDLDQIAPKTFRFPLSEIARKLGALVCEIRRSS
jgi:hypothetical protein